MKDGLQTVGKDFSCLNLLPEGKTKVKFPNLSIWIDVRDGKISFADKKSKVDFRKQYNFVCGDLKHIATEAGVPIREFKEKIGQAIINLV